MKKNSIKKLKTFTGVLLASVLLSTFVFQGCDDNQYDPPTFSGDVSFMENILPIFETNKCGICHGGSQSPNLTPAKAYESLADGYISDDPENDPESSKIYTKLKDGHSSTVSALDLSTLLEWIRQGAQNN